MTLSDEELVERYRESESPDRDSFLNQLFERHHSKVAAWCYRITGNVDEATDLAQEVFLKAFQHLASFRGNSKFTTWLYSITRNHCMDALKSRASGPLQAGEDVLERMEDFRAGDLASGLERRQAEELMRQLMDEALDETEGQVMTLHFVEELSLDAVTRLLGLKNASGAKAYVVSARRKLARAFEQWNERAQRRKGGGHAESQT
jgi:RNA polymerase sigma-70 factor (ECF subfamily)